MNQIFQDIVFGTQDTQNVYVGDISSFRFFMQILEDEITEGVDAEKQGCLDELEKISKYEENLKYECEICYNQQDSGLKLICDHFFCEGCVIQWLQTSRKCPICQKDLIEEYENKKKEKTVQN